MAVSVLLVDDTAFLRSMLREILEASGSYVILAEASDGVAALTLQPELNPDLVVSDLIMPGLDGIEMTRALVAADPTVRIVVTAAEDQEGAVLSALAAGARDFLPKPFSRAKVLQILAPDPPPSSGTAPEAEYRLRLTLAPDTPLKAARARVLLSRCRQVGSLLDDLSQEPSPPAAREEGTLRFRLRTPQPPAILRAWLERLPEVAGVGIEAPPAPEKTGAPSHRDGARSLQGSVRLRASLLDRLLDRVEDSKEARGRFSRTLGGSLLPPEAAAAFQDLERCLTDLGTEILAARLVPFERIAPRLHRCVEDSARAHARQASLVLSGGGTRLDLGVLEALASLLSRLLPRMVEAGIQRGDILRQLGKPEVGEIRIGVTRSRSALKLLCQAGESAGTRPLDLEENAREMARRLGGRIALVREGEEWKIEIVVPAGVELVRSYLCQAGGRLFAVPVGMIDEALTLEANRVRVLDGRSVWEGEAGESIPLVRFARIPWVVAEGASHDGFPALVYRVGPQRYALALDAVLGETEVVMKPLPGRDGSREVAGMALLSDGGIAVVPDLPHLARMG